MSTMTRKQMAVAAQEQWTPSDLKSAGWTPSAIRAAGLTPRALRLAGWTPLDIRAAGWTPSDLKSAGWPQADIDEFEKQWDSIPTLQNPYTELLADIKSKKRIHEQSTFGPDDDPEQNLCASPMCTAGHLDNMAGAVGYALAGKYGFPAAAMMIAEKAHPGWPQQNYGRIPQAWALAFIEEMAEREANQQKSPSAEEEAT